MVERREANLFLLNLLKYFYDQEGSLDYKSVFA